MPTSPIVQLLTVFGLTVCVLSLWKGGVAERIGAALVLTSILFSLFGAMYLPSEVFLVAQMVGDALVALGLLVLAVRYASLWLGGAMLLYAAQFTLHSFYFVTQRPNDLFHATMNNINFLGVIFCVGVGAVTAMRRRLRARAPARA
jgi:hypothetical protein